MKALQIAASGMAAQQMRVDVDAGSAVLCDCFDGYLADAIASFKTAGAVSTAYLNQAQTAASTDD